MKTSLVIFDLDGTLLDTIGDLAVACNAVLGVRGLPQHTYEEYCHFVGNGILRLVERALPEPLRTPETVAAVRADFVKYYTEHIDAHTRPYDGIPELIAELARRGVALAVASNKFQAGTEKLVGLFFPGVTFAAVLGQRPGVPLKPSPAVVEEILARTGTAREEVLYVGVKAEALHQKQFRLRCTARTEDRHTALPAPALLFQARCRPRSRRRLQDLRRSRRSGFSQYLRWSLPPPHRFQDVP